MTMSRRVYTEEDVKALRNENIQDGKEDDLATQILKYIPAEIVAAFIAIDSIFRSVTATPPMYVQWIVFIVLVIATPLYLWRVTYDENLNTAKGQMVVGIIAFIVWVYTIGGPFTSFDWYNAQSYWGSIGIAICTVAFPIILGKTTSGVRKEKKKPSAV